jgi:Peptidase family M28
MRRLLRSVVRIVIATSVILLISYAGACIAITQPFCGATTITFEGNSDPAVLERHVRFLTTDAFPRHYQHPDSLNLAADYIAKSLVEAGAAVSTQTYTAGRTEQRNVIARLGGEGPPRLVVGAHYDACGELPGADDNASGVAGLLELARLLGREDLPAPLELVAYSTEEPPFFGSAEMGSAEHAAGLGSVAQLTGMISLEMIGFYSAEQPAPSWPIRLLYPSAGDFVLITGRWEDRKLIESVKSAMRTVPKLKVESYCGPTGLGSDLSDHRNYWSIGASAVMITDTAFVRNANYHLPSDTADTLDYPLMARTVDGVARAAVAILREARE